MNIRHAYFEDDGALIALIEVGRNGDEVGLQDVELTPEDPDYDAALKIAQNNQEDNK